MLISVAIGCRGLSGDGRHWGCGEACCELLLKRNIRVRALVRNRSKALAFLCGGAEPKPGGGDFLVSTNGAGLVGGLMTARLVG